MASSPSRVIEIEIHKRTGSWSWPLVLDVAVRASVAGMVFSVVTLGHVAETLPLFYAVMGLSLLLYVLARGEELLRSAFDYLTSGLVIWRWAFLVWALLSLLWTARGAIAASRAFTLVEVHAVGLVFYDAAKRLRLTKWMLGAVFASAAVSVLYALLTEDPTRTAGRLTGTYGNPNTLAIMGVLGLTVFFSGVMSAGRIWSMITTYLGSVVLLLGVLASASLKGIGGTLSSFLIAVVIPGSRRRAWTLMALVIGFMTVLFAVVAQLRTYWEEALRRVDVTFTTLGMSVGANESIVERLEFIRKGAALIAEAPVVGRGLESFRWLSGAGTYAHNNFIEIAVALGLIGVVLYYVFPLVILIAAIRSRGLDRDIKRFILIAIPTLIILDVAFVSYATKLVSLLLVSLAGAIEGGSVRRDD